MTSVPGESVEVARANAYHVLARVLAPPAEMDTSQPVLLRYTFLQLSESLHAPAAKTADAWETALEDREPLAVAYARLFLGPFEVLAPPYESMYLDPEQRLMGRVSQAVAEAYTNAGLGPGSGPKEVPDHITLELEFMYFLGFQAIATDDSLWSERRQQFWRIHLGRWLPDLSKNMAQADCHPCYTALGKLLKAFCQSEAVFFSDAC